MLGAPPLATTFPFLPTTDTLEVAEVETPPTAAFTPGTARTFASTDSGKLGVMPTPLISFFTTERPAM